MSLTYIRLHFSKRSNRECVFKGWQLLCVVLITFPPSKDFETYLRSFIQNHTAQQDNRVDVMAKYCLRRLIYISSKGPRGKAPTLAEIDAASVRLSSIFNTIFTNHQISGCCVQSLNLRRNLGRHHATTGKELSSPQVACYHALSC
jgi:hypothetical protein